MATQLTRLRFSFVKAGANIQAFHAAEDKQVHRDAVVACLAANPTWNFGAIVVEKAKVNLSIRDEYTFYPKFASMVLRFVFRGCVRPGTSKVLIYTDILPVAKHRDSIEKSIKLSCRAEFGTVMPFETFHHSRTCNAWLQVVDYCCWAVFRKWEGGDPRTYNQLRARLEKPELDVLARGADRYY